MRILSFSILLLSSLFCKAQKFYLLAGTYTNTGSKGIYVYEFNATTGKAIPVGNTDSVSNPSYITLSNNGNFLYAVNENHGDIPGGISAFSFDKKTGTLKYLNSQNSGGDDPCYISVSGNNKWLTVSNYSGGNVTVFPINKNGTIQPYTQLMQDTGTSINTERQEKAHVHESVFSPDGSYLYTPDLGIDKLVVYKFNPLLKKPLVKTSYIPIPLGSGPRHIIFSPNKKLAYVICELSGTVITYAYNNNKLTEVQQIATHPEGFKGVIGSAEIAESSDGKYLYASNRGDENTITIFSVNKTTGKLKTIAYQPVLGKAPRNFIIDATGNYLIVANQDSNNIVIFKRNAKTGLLTPTKEQINVPRPVCLQIVKMNH